MAQSNHWQLIPFENFERPSAPASTVIQQAWSHVRTLFGRTDSDETEDVAQDFPHYREFALPPAVAAIDAAWQEATDAPRVRFVISPPFSGTGAVLRAWAEQHHYRTITPPSIAQLSSADTELWWQQQQVGDRPWLMDEFSSFWLRTTEHLAFVRALLPRLLRGELGQGVVVIDSWTYAFLQRAWPLALPHCYCFAAATPELLQQVGITASDKQLRKLTAQARGNLGVALALWAVAQSSDKRAPSLPSEADDSTAFILYSLLLHHGLQGEHLQWVLPMLAADQLDVQLLRLQQHGVVEYDDQVWRVTAYAYREVRDFLSGRGYWLDAF